MEIKLGLDTVLEVVVTIKDCLRLVLERSEKSRVYLEQSRNPLTKLLHDGLTAQFVRIATAAEVGNAMSLKFVS